MLFELRDLLLTDSLHMIVEGVRSDDLDQILYGVQNLDILALGYADARHEKGPITILMGYCSFFFRCLKQ